VDNWSLLSAFAEPGHEGRGDGCGVGSRAHRFEHAHEGPGVPYVTTQSGGGITTRDEEVLEQVRAVALETPLGARRAHLDPVRLVEQGQLTAGALNQYPGGRGFTGAEREPAPEASSVHGNDANA